MLKKILMTEMAISGKQKTTATNFAVFNLYFNDNSFVMKINKGRKF